MENKSFISRLAKHFDLAAYLEPRVQKKSGDEYILNCPICEQEGKQDKLWCNVKKKLSWCYYCKASYDVQQLIRLLEDCSLVRMIEILKDYTVAATETVRSEVDRVLSAMSAIDDEDDDEGQLPEIRLPQGFVAALDEEKLPKYFAERGISRRRAIRYDLGWTYEGYYANRLIVPVTQEGRLVAFHARYLKKQTPIAECWSCDGSGKDLEKKVCRTCKGEGKARVKKVLYPKGTKTGHLLFNFDNVKHCRTIVTAEDCFSTMAIGLSKDRTAGATGTFGTHITKHQLALLLTSEAEEIVMCWDNDAIESAYEQAERLGEFWRVRVVELPDERDPDEYGSRAERWEIIHKARSAGNAKLSSRVKARLKNL